MCQRLLWFFITLISSYLNFSDKEMEAEGLKPELTERGYGFIVTLGPSPFVLHLNQESRTSKWATVFKWSFNGSCYHDNSTQSHGHGDSDLKWRERMEKVPG
jgi:hypothetical protein